MEKILSLPRRLTDTLRMTGDCAFKAHGGDIRAANPPGYPHREKHPTSFIIPGKARNLTHVLWTLRDFFEKSY